MEEFKYTPDDDIQVHEEGAIHLICAPFQSHENGIPEWIKNSSDAYVRSDKAQEQRIILLIINHGSYKKPASISCLDFLGMTKEIIENNFRIWADPDAAKQGAINKSIQGGHGNGGKCYMTQMFDDYALITTVKNKKGNRYGVISGSVKFGYIPDKIQGRDFPVEDTFHFLSKLLTDLHCPIHKLPQEILDVVQQSDGFTLVTGMNPKSYGYRIPLKKIIENLEDHSQMIRSLELCRIYVMSTGTIQNDGKPLSLPLITPMEGIDKPRIISIPTRLEDPLSGHDISTNNNGLYDEGNLILRTSAKSMRYSRRVRHNIVYLTSQGYIGYKPVLELDIQSPYRDYIYGECNLESLNNVMQNERISLANSTLTRAIEGFISKQIEQYAKEFEARDRRRYNQEAKNALSTMNEALDKWKNRFLEDYLRGLWGPGTSGPHPPQPPLPTGIPTRIEIGLTHQLAGIGVSFRPVIHFFDSQNRHIRSIPYKWVSDNTNIALVDEELMIINTFAYGKTTLYAETIDRKLKSNIIPIEVVRIKEIEIIPEKIEISCGSRYRFEGICTLDDDTKTSKVHLIWTESDPNVARVSSGGLVYAFSQGVTNVIAGDDHCITKNPAIISVVAGDGKGRGVKKGQGYPMVLISGEIDRDPDTDEYVHFSIEDPPIWQRPQDYDRNIWWINSSSPLARLYLSIENGYGYESREWRMYHLERYIDIIVQIALIHSPNESGLISANDWVMQWGAKVAEIQAAAASDLVGFIADGTLPIE